MTLNANASVHCSSAIPVSQALASGMRCRYVKNRSVIVTTVRCFLLVFLTLLVPAIVKGSSEHPTCSDWIDISGMWPLAAISMGLLVSHFGLTELEILRTHVHLMLPRNISICNPILVIAILLVLSMAVIPAHD